MGLINPLSISCLLSIPLLIHLILMMAPPTHAHSTSGMSAFNVFSLPNICTGPLCGVDAVYGPQGSNLKQGWEVAALGGFCVVASLILQIEL
jgi:hypothetical protein